MSYLDFINRDIHEEICEYLDVFSLYEYYQVIETPLSESFWNRLAIKHLKYPLESVNGDPESFFRQSIAEGGLISDAYIYLQPMTYGKRLVKFNKINYVLSNEDTITLRGAFRQALKQANNDVVLGLINIGVKFEVRDWIWLGKSGDTTLIKFFLTALNDETFRSFFAFPYSYRKGDRIKLSIKEEVIASNYIQARGEYKVCTDSYFGLPHTVEVNKYLMYGINKHDTEYNLPPSFDSSEFSNSQYTSCICKPKTDNCKISELNKGDTRALDWLLKKTLTIEQVCRISYLPFLELLGQQYIGLDKNQWSYVDLINFRYRGLINIIVPEL